MRESLRMPGSFVLTMWARNQVHHFQIVGHGDGWFSVDNGPLFQGLDDLVHHYQCRADGLPAQLNDFITGHPPPLSAMKRLETSLHRAVSNRDVVSVRRALSQQANPSSGSVDSQNGEGSTPVHEAAKKGYVEVLGPLLDHKPDLTIRDSKGSTSLQVWSLCVCVCLCVLCYNVEPLVKHFLECRTLKLVHTLAFYTLSVCVCVCVCYRSGS